LQSAADAIRLLEVVAHLIELSDREDVGEIVRPTLVPGDRDSAVVTNDEVCGISWIDPHRVPVSMNAQRTATIALAAVGAEAEHTRHPIDAILINGIDTNLRVVKGTLLELI